MSLLSLDTAQVEVEQKLCQGWTLTNKSCPISLYPLLKSPEGILWSVPCQMAVKEDFATEEEISARLGEKLLIGWTMLEENCPSGLCPLMFDPIKKMKWSAATGGYLRSEERHEERNADANEQHEERGFQPSMETIDEKEAAKGVLLVKVRSVRKEMERIQVTAQTPLSDLERLEKLAVLLNGLLLSLDKL